MTMKAHIQAAMNERIGTADEVRVADAIGGQGPGRPGSERAR